MASVPTGKRAAEGTVAAAAAAADGGEKRPKGPMGGGAADDDDVDAMLKMKAEMDAELASGAFDDADLDLGGFCEGSKGAGRVMEDDEDEAAFVPAPQSSGGGGFGGGGFGGGGSQWLSAPSADDLARWARPPVAKGFDPKASSLAFQWTAVDLITGDVLERHPRGYTGGTRHKATTYTASTLNTRTRVNGFKSSVCHICMCCLVLLPPHPLPPVLAALGTACRAPRWVRSPWCACSA